MKEISGVALNRFLAEGKEGYLALGEIVIVVSEPKYEFDASGSMIKRRVVEEFRVSTSAKGMRDIAKDMLEWADILDGDQRRIDDALDIDHPEPEKH